MAPDDSGQSGVNKDGTGEKIGTKLTQPDSRLVRYEIVDRSGGKHGPFWSIVAVEQYAVLTWPEQKQDPERTDRGWDVQVVGCE